MKKGFTILELLVVIMVIAILLGIALPRFKGMQDEGNIAKAKAELRTLQVAVESYYIHNANTYPATGSAAFAAAITAATPNIIAITPTDPFGTGLGYAYVLNAAGGKFYAIYSIGSGGNGLATITNNAVVETANPSSCIYVSNASQDTVP